VRVKRQEKKEKDEDNYGSDGGMFDDNDDDDDDDDEDESEINDGDGDGICDDTMLMLIMVKEFILMIRW
jgi:hypothetical protein